MKPCRVSVTTRSPAASKHAHRFGFGEASLRVVVVVVDGDDATLSLRDDLLGDDDDVSALQAFDARNNLAEAGARSDFREPRDRHHREGRRRRHVGAPSPSAHAARDPPRLLAMS